MTTLALYLWSALAVAMVAHRSDEVAGRREGDHPTLAELALVAAFWPLAPVLIWWVRREDR